MIGPCIDMFLIHADMLCSIGLFKYTVTDISLSLCCDKKSASHLIKAISVQVSCVGECISWWLVSAVNDWDLCWLVLSDYIDLLQLVWSVLHCPDSPVV